MKLKVSPSVVRRERLNNGSLLDARNTDGRIYAWYNDLLLESRGERYVHRLYLCV